MVRSASTIVMGSNAMWWDGDALHVRLEERAPISGRRLEGTVIIHAPHRNAEPIALDAAGKHRWYPVAPHARAEVRLSKPSLHFSGSAYTDANAGTEPLEQAFRRWDWSRADVEDGSVVLYDVVSRDGLMHPRGWRFSYTGERQDVDPSTVCDLGRALWGVQSGTRCDAGGESTIKSRLEDTPFYRRNLIETQLEGQRVLGMHEHLDLDRFTSPWVQFLLPFRIRRVR